MHPDLERALQPVLDDLRATSAPLPRRVDDDRPDSDDDGPFAARAMLWGHDGRGQGVFVELRLSQPEQVAQVADGVQAWAVEELWGSAPTNWPRCPRHPDTHPLQAQVRDAAAWWVCPRDDVPVSEVGGLG
ncbi:hypothetical protein O2V63_17355 [Modestobacter sp. VKM Ac-2977]|uniref:hypothetical protein n=1 Tax=Modestobacter sp. VKM Ac-2977 TaxID=3004131 RepID=UPI0022AA29FD|nr:hypothetical protein [Modestobacter sp. VKM Ac-2977]MCZ2822110.1 hypothetical protein [Modestobacter sp. VKM Ac-2977]